MLNFIIGPAGSGKTTAIYEKIADMNGQIIFIVPDQFIFETEKRIAEKTGEQHGSIKICGFNSIAEDIISLFDKERSYADTVAKTVIMQRTIRNAAASGLIGGFGKRAGNAGFAEFMLKIIDELKREGISCDKIDSFVSEKREAVGHSLADKLSSIEQIYRIYDGMLSEFHLCDRQDNMRNAAQLVAENRYFEDYSVFVDGFDHFGGAQVMMLQEIVKKAPDCTVALTFDGSDSDYFLQQKKLINKLKLAFEDGTGDNCSITSLSGDYRYKDAPALKVLRDTLPCDKLSDKEIIGKIGDEIRLAYAPTVQTEAETVCAEITRLIREEGYRYNDIAVLTPSPALYADKINSAALLYDIPLFADIPMPLSEKPLLKYIISLLVAADNPTGENILRYIKSGFARINEGKDSREILDKEIYSIESYCKEWDIYNRTFDRAFNKGTEDSGLEKLRKSICDPLVDLKNSCKGKNGKEITILLTDFMFSNNSISHAIMGMCWDKANKRFDKQLNDEYNQLWNMVSDLLTSVYNTISEEECYTLTEYAEIIKTCADTVTVSRTPRVLDSVIFGDTVRTRCNDVKAVFVVGAVAEKFPPQTERSEVFTKQELKIITDSGFYIKKTEDEQYSENLMSVYNCLCQASKRLYISYSGDRDNYAECIGLIKNLFKVDIEEADSDYMLYCSRRGAAKKMLASYAVRDKQKAANIRQALIDVGDTEYTGLVDSALSRTNNHNIGESAGLLLRRDMMSPTAIEKMCGCRFAYFLKYGLGLGKDKTQTLNSVNIGNIGHYIFKEAFEKIYENGRPQDTPDFELLVRQGVEKYREKNIPKGMTMSPQFERSFENITEIFTIMLEYMFYELQKGEFIPKYNEQPLEKNGRTADGFATEPFNLEIELDNSKIIVPIGGTIDRVDIYEDNSGNKQIRVVDYKTYEKKMSFTKNYYGLDLQILLYLFALTDCNSNSIPSAAVYYPVHNLPAEKDVKDSLDSRSELWMKKHRQQGIVLAGTRAVEERELYTDSEDKNYFKAVRMDDAVFKKLRERAESEIRDNLERLWSGDVAANPVVDGYNRIACEYCKFSDICNFNGGCDSDLKIRDLRDEKAESFKDNMNSYEYTACALQEDEKRKQREEEERKKQEEKERKKAEAEKKKEEEKQRKAAEREAKKALKEAEKATKKGKKAKPAEKAEEKPAAEPQGVYSEQKGDKA